MGNEAWGDRTAIYRHISEVMKRLGLEAPTYGYTENHAALVMILNGFLECEKRVGALQRPAPDITQPR